MNRSWLALALGVAMGTAACGSSGDGSGAPTDDEAELKSGKVTLRLPLLDANGKRPLLSTRNPELQKLGLGTVPDTIELEGDAKGNATAASRKKWSDIDALVTKAQEKSSNVEMVLLAEPSEYMTKSTKTSICYTGNPLLVVPLIQSLTDGAFSDQLSIHGWKYKQKVFTDLSDEDQEQFMPDVWKEWRGKGEAILTVTASSDGGEETNVGIIPKCK